MGANAPTSGPGFFRIAKAHRHIESSRHHYHQLTAV